MNNGIIILGSVVNTYQQTSITRRNRNEQVLQVMGMKELQPHCSHTATASWLISTKSPGEILPMTTETRVNSSSNNE